VARDRAVATEQAEEGRQGSMTGGGYPPAAPRPGAGAYRRPAAWAQSRRSPGLDVQNLL